MKNKTVFVVMDGEDYPEIDAIFSTRELAEAFIASIEQDRFGVRKYIEELEIDTNKRHLKKQKKLYFVEINNTKRSINANVIGQGNKSTFSMEIGDYHLEHFKEGIWVCCFAKDQNEAIKIARWASKVNNS